MNTYQDSRNVSLLVQPGDSFFPLAQAIDRARESIKMTIFRMDDPVVRDSMRRAVSRGVKVQALVAPDSKGWNKRNRKLGEDLEELGIEVTFPEVRARRLKRYHYKLMMIDGRESLILTFNPTRKNLHYSRDFGLVIKDEALTGEINRLFEADWHGHEFKPSGLPLVISPDNSRHSIAKLVATAARSIRIMDQKVRDEEIIALLGERAEAGCDVKIIGMTRVPSSKLRVRRLERYKLHAKCIVVDSTMVFIGSQNLRPVSLDRRRELGIIIQDEAIARKIERVFDEDWSESQDQPPADA